MKILITGITGFIGTNLVSFLRNYQFEIGGASRVPDDNRGFIEYNKITNDLIDSKKISVIIHLAGKAHDIKKIDSSDEYVRANTILSTKIFEAFLKSEAKIFIILSSVKAVRDTLSEEALTEDMSPNPNTIYGKTKLLTEEYILSQRIPVGKRVFILRPCMIHGPGNKGNLNLLYRFVTKGIPYPLASFKNRRSFLSVTNLCFVIKELCTRSDIPSGIYQVADDQPLSTNRVIQLMGETLQKKVVFWQIPRSVIRFLAGIGDVLGLPLNSERLGKLTENYVVSNAKLLAALQKELPITAEEGLRITIRSF